MRARYVAFSILATGTTSISYSTVLSRWFNRYHGLALGISLAGVGLGGALWSLVAQRLFVLVGWRDAFPIMGAAIAVTMVPLMLITMCDYPSSKGLEVDGDSRLAPAQSEKSGFPLSEIFSSTPFWLMAVSFFFLSIILYGVMLNLVPLLRTRGLPTDVAIRVQALQWFVIVVGRIGTGFLIDPFSRHVSRSFCSFCP